MDVTAPTPTITITAPKPAEPKSHFWVGHGFSFHDVLDALNPLQHLPIIAPIYRSLTGDKIGNVARVIGDGIYGGPIGLASGVADSVLAETTGKDFGQHIMATLGLEKDAAPEAESAPASSPGSAPTPLAPMAASTPQAVAMGNATPFTGAQNRSILPQLGSTSTASALAAAAPVTAATVSASGMPMPGRGFPIDASSQGIARIRAQSLAHNPQPVALQLPPGTMVPSQAPKPSVAPGDFVQKMQEGLDRYAALMSAKLPRGEAFDAAQ